MSDLLEVLPNFDVRPYTHLLYSLEKNNITVTDLISLDPREVVRQCPLPLSDLQRFIDELLKGLRDDIRKNTRNVTIEKDISDIVKIPERQDATTNCVSIGSWYTVKTLDPKIDAVLGGGFYPGHITEVVGESAVGKTQFVMGILLSCQLSPPNGIGRSSIYLSTEAPLSTERLHQLLESHPTYKELPVSGQPSLDQIHTLSTNDLETQCQVIQYQLPIAVKRYNVGLIVIDSVTANFRAEHETKTVTGLADRATDLYKLGVMLRRIAIENNIAIVVTNQISDRFEDPPAVMSQGRSQYSSQEILSSPPNPSLKISTAPNSQQENLFSLDYQQRFFTGWGEQTNAGYENLKTPALGMAWTNQISARIVLKMKTKRNRVRNLRETNLWSDTIKQRSLIVVFAPWTKPTTEPVEYEITKQGIVSISETEGTEQEVGASGMNYVNIRAWDDEDVDFP